MVTCLLCGFHVELDDAAVLLATRPRCICLRCFARETGSARLMPAALRREVAACLPTDA
jgi:hypothetical protein